MQGGKVQRLIVGKENDGKDAPHQEKPEPQNELFVGIQPPAVAEQNAADDQQRQHHQLQQQEDGPGGRPLGQVSPAQDEISDDHRRKQQDGRNKPGAGSSTFFHRCHLFRRINGPKTAEIVNFLLKVVKY